MKISVISHVVTLNRRHANGSHYASKASAWLKSSSKNECTFPVFLLALSESLPQLAILEHSNSTLEDLQEVSFILISTDSGHRCLKQTMNCECRVGLQNHMGISVQGTSCGIERTLETKRHQ